MQMSKKSILLCIAAFLAAALVLAYAGYRLFRDDSTRVDPSVLHVAWITPLHDDEKTAALEQIMLKAVQDSGYSDVIHEVEVYDIPLVRGFDPATVLADSGHQLMLVPSSMGNAYFENEYVDFMFDFSDSQVFLDAEIEDHGVCLIDWESYGKAPKGQTDKFLAILNAID